MEILWIPKRAHNEDVCFQKEKKWNYSQKSSRNHMKIKNLLFCKKQFESKYLKGKKYWKVRDHCHYAEEYEGAEHSICNLK